jgi:undecaprenyl-diphosphatase
MPSWIQGVDEQLMRWFQAHHTRFLDNSFQNLTALGSTTVVTVVSLFCLGMLLLNHQYKRAVVAVVVLVAAYYATQGVKAWVGRPRPVLEQPVEAGGSSASFPSSHASLAMTVYPMYALCLRHSAKQVRRYAVISAVLLALVVGLSRLYFGNHFLSDVIVGWLFGILFVLAFYLADRLAVDGKFVPPGM